VSQLQPLMVPLQREIDFAFYPRVPMISLELTNHCNLKCPYCANVTLTRPKTYIDWSFFERMVDECAERKFNLAYLHGVGEPLLWDRLEEAVALIKRKGAGMGTFGTNGTLLFADRVKSLLDAGLDSIYVSIDTLDPEIYAKTRGGKLSKVIANVQEMIRIVPKNFLITIALMEHKDHHITQATIDHFHSVFGHNDNVRSNLVTNALFPSAPGDYRVSPEKIQHCRAPINYLFIALDGRAAICCLDQDVLHSLGNVAERSIYDVWFDHKTQTTLRNVALGIYSCPSACTENCVLLPPSQSVNSVVLGLGVPFDEAAKLFNTLMYNNQQAAALPILEALMMRDPNHPELRAVHQKLTSPAPKLTLAAS